MPGGAGVRAGLRRLVVDRLPLAQAVDHDREVQNDVVDAVVVADEAPVLEDARHEAHEAQRLIGVVEQLRACEGGEPLGALAGDEVVDEAALVPLASAERDHVALALDLYAKARDLVAHAPQLRLERRVSDVELVGKVVHVDGCRGPKQPAEDGVGSAALVVVGRGRAGKVPVAQAIAPGGGLDERVALGLVDAAHVVVHRLGRHPEHLRKMPRIDPFPCVGEGLQELVVYQLGHAVAFLVPYWSRSNSMEDITSA